MSWKDRNTVSELADILRGWAVTIGNADLRADVLDAADALTDLDEENDRLVESVRWAS